MLQQFKAIPNGVDVADIQDITFGDMSKGLIEIKLIVKEEVDIITF